MTASCFSEVAHHPTSLWVSIATTALTHELVAASGQFTLVVLHDGQGALAMRLGMSSGRELDRCASLALRRDAEGFWYMDDAMVSIACRVLRSHTLGDHTLFIARILRAECETRHLIRRQLLTTDLHSP